MLAVNMQSSNDSQISPLTHMQHVSAACGEISICNPATQAVVATISDASIETIDQTVQAATSAATVWRNTDVALRLAILQRIGAAVRLHAIEFASVEVREVGRSIREIATVDVPETAGCFEFYSECLSTLRGRNISVGANYDDHIDLDPIGVVAAITPSNFPLNIAAWKIAPALAAGNALILKPSERASTTALMLAKIASEVGLPDGVLNVVTGRGSSAGLWLLEHPGVDMITFTGGPEAGRIVAERGARLGKRVALELGGKSAQIVFADADLDAAAASIVEGFCFASGQNCCAGSRLLVQASVREEIQQRVVSKANALVIGDPTKSETDIGCVISKEHAATIEGFLNRAAREGLEVRRLGKLDVPENSPPTFVSPALVLDPSSASEIFQREVFGPVLTINSFDSEEQAVELANATSYDLAAGVWTKDEANSRRMVRKLRAGTVWVNTFNRIFNRAPFGGVRGSGQGRDLGLEALAQYQSIKNVCISRVPGSDKWY